MYESPLYISSKEALMPLADETGLLQEVLHFHQDSPPGQAPVSTLRMGLENVKGCMFVFFREVP